MRKNSARKWLHATLDLLPVIIIPLFAIFMHRHDATTYEVEVSQNEVVNFNQRIDNDLLRTSNNFYGLTISKNNGVLHVSGTLDITTNVQFQLTNYFYSNNSDLYYFKANSPCMVRTIKNGVDSYNWQPLISSFDSAYFYLYFTSTSSGTTYNFNLYLQAFNLTQMFGEGNEPTINEFNSYYSDDYYPYNTGTRQLLKDVSTVTYNNTDIGSQLVYALYTPINDYMNFNNVFNFGAIYDWLQLNIFNGNAPLSVFIVWNIFLYEFLMDLIFLLYALFMFFIDFCTNLIDRFHCKASGGH